VGPFAAGAFEAVCDRLIALLSPNLSPKMNSGCSVRGISSKHLSITALPLASVDPPFSTHSFHDQRLQST